MNDSPLRSAITREACFGPMSNSRANAGRLDLANGTETKKLLTRKPHNRDEVPKSLERVCSERDPNQRVLGPLPIPWNARMLARPRLRKAGLDKRNKWNKDDCNANSEDPERRRHAVFGNKRRNGQRKYQSSNSSSC